MPRRRRTGEDTGADEEKEDAGTEEEEDEGGRWFQGGEGGWRHSRGEWRRMLAPKRRRTEEVLALRRKRALAPRRRRTLATRMRRTEKYVGTKENEDRGGHWYQ